MSHCKNCGTELPKDAMYCPRCGAPVEATIPSPEQPRQFANGLKSATWGERFVAWLIDIIVLNIALVILSLIIYPLHPFLLIRNEPWWASVFNFTTSGLVFFLYWLLMDGAYGQSLGKMVLGLRIRRLDGERITFGQAALESVGKAFFLPIDYLVGWALYPRRRQRIFNYFSETVVLRK